MSQSGGTDPEQPDRDAEGSARARASIILIAVVFYVLLACMVLAVAAAVYLRLGR